MGKAWMGPLQESTWLALGKPDVVTKGCIWAKPARGPSRKRLGFPCPYQSHGARGCLWLPVVAWDQTRLAIWETLLQKKRNFSEPIFFLWPWVTGKNGFRKVVFLLKKSVAVHLLFQHETQYSIYASKNDEHF